MIRAFHHLMNLTGKQKMKRQRWWWETVLCLLPFCPATQSTLNKHGPKPNVMILSPAFLPGKQGGPAVLSISVKSDTRYLHDKLHV